MFAPLVAKAYTKEGVSSIPKLVPQRSMRVDRPFGCTVGKVRMLQRSIGNQATLRLLAQRATTLTGNELHGQNGHQTDQASLNSRAAAPGVAWDYSKIPIFPPDRESQPEARSAFAVPFLPEVIQAKFSVGRVEDPLEHEADRVAEQVLRMPATERDFQLNHGNAAPQADGEELSANAARTFTGLDFGGVSLHAKQAAAAVSGPQQSCDIQSDCKDFPNLHTSNPCASPEPQWPSYYGKTECHFPGGIKMTIPASGCERPCIESHESVHREQAEDCCQRANFEYMFASNDAEKDRIKCLYCQWQASILHTTECRAYGVSNPCLHHRYKEKNCDNKTLSQSDKECCGEIYLALISGESDSTKEHCRCAKPTLTPCPFHHPVGP